jgi:glutathione-regulated potassium-efflux system ancillary protein KefG
MPPRAPRNKILVLFAHPALHKSRVNRQMAAAASELPGVTFCDLYEKYPDLAIDIQAEQKTLLEHDVVVLQHPFYWYSTPSILKEWSDLVLEYGFAYGEGGDKLNGKLWIHALTTGGPAEAYRREGYNRFTIRELLAPLDQTAHLCQMPFLAPFTVHGTLRLDPKTEIPRMAAQYRELLEALRDLEWTPELAARMANWSTINAHIRELGAQR